MNKLSLARFLRTATYIFLVTAGAKLFSAFGSARILSEPDPLLVVPTRLLLVIVGILELLLAIYLIAGRSTDRKGIFVFVLSLNFVIYRLGLYLSGIKICPCLGTILDALPIDKRLLEWVSIAILAYIFFGSGYFLVRLLNRHRQHQNSLPRGGAHAAGFTLLELLVTIAIIGILASFLTIAISRAKWSARNLVCKNNARQISLAFQLYDVDYGAYPLYQQPFEGWAAHYWWEQISDYIPMNFGPFPDRLLSRTALNGQQVMRGVHLCPFQKGFQHYALQGRPSKIGLPLTSYGYNRSGIGLWSAGKAFRMGLGVGGLDPVTDKPGPDPASTTAYKRPTPSSSIVSPADMITVGDGFIRSVQPGMDGMRSNGEDCGYYSLSTVGSSVNPKTNLTFRAHRGKFNFAFADSHVEVMDMNKQFVPNDRDMRRWNRDNEPHPEFWRE